MENARTVITHFVKSSIDRSVELTADVPFLIFLIKYTAARVPSDSNLVHFNSANEYEEGPNYLALRINKL